MTALSTIFTTNVHNASFDIFGATNGHLFFSLWAYIFFPLGIYVFPTGHIFFPSCKIIVDFVPTALVIYFFSCVSKNHIFYSHLSHTYFLDVKKSIYFIPIGLIFFPPYFFHRIPFPDSHFYLCQRLQ